MLNKLSQENQIIDLPDLNRFCIGDHVVADATFDHDRHEGVVIGIELQRAHGASRLKLAPSITLLHDVDQITDGFHPNHLRKVEAPSPAPETSKIFHPGLIFPPEPPMDGNGSQWNSEPTAPAPKLRVTGFRGNPLRVVLSSGQEATITQKLIDAFASPSPFDQTEWTPPSEADRPEGYECLVTLPVRWERCFSGRGLVWAPTEPGVRIESLAQGWAPLPTADAQEEA